MPGEVRRSDYPVDPDVLELAKMFLDAADMPGEDPRGLAETIQKAVEDWFLLKER